MASEPELASESPYAPIHSHVASLGRQRCFCSSVPYHTSGRVAMPMCAPKAVEKLASVEMWSVISVELSLSRPMPPYSSGMSTAVKPNSAALRNNSTIAPGSLASMAATRGRISSRAKRAAVAAIWRCSSFRSSGVRISLGVRVSSRKLPPAAAAMGDTSVKGMVLRGLLLPKRKDQHHDRC